jgi:cytidylate kinase
VEKIANQKHHSIFTDFFATFSDHYTPSDLEVKKALAGVIRTMAMQGRVILIGRGAVSLTQDLDDSIHVFLYGSRDWRIQKAMERLELTSEEEARKKLDKIDFERSYLRNFYAGKTTDLSYYDICFNAETTGIEEMAEAVISLMERRGFLA